MGGGAGEQVERESEGGGSGGVLRGNVHPLSSLLLPLLFLGFLDCYERKWKSRRGGKRFFSSLPSLSLC